MVELHPDSSRLEKFGRGSLSRLENREIVRHLLSGCVSCRRVTERFLVATGSLSLPDDGVSSFDYSVAFEAARNELRRKQISFAAEQEAAPILFRELSSYTFDRQWLLVTHDARFQSWAFCDLLLESSRDWDFQDPGRALDLAELAATVAAHLSPALYGKARINDLSARAWATLANAERVRADFRSAEKAFRRAEQLLKEGTGDPLEKARLLLLKADLCGHQGRLPEAFRLLARVAHIARANGDLHLVGKALVTKGFFCGVAGQLEEAIRLLEEGIQQLDLIAEPRLLVVARQNLILYLSESGRIQEAQALLAQIRSLQEDLGDRMNLARLQWVEGKIAVSQGEYEQAEAFFLQVRQELIAHGLGMDAALLSLDLAGVYARQGRSTEMRQLAEEIFPFFLSCEVQRETLAALIVFQKAAEMERVTLDLVQELREYLKKSRERS